MSAAKTTKAKRDVNEVRFWRVRVTGYGSFTVKGTRAQAIAMGRDKAEWEGGTSSVKPDLEATSVDENDDLTKPETSGYSYFPDGRPWVPPETIESLHGRIDKFRETILRLALQADDTTANALRSAIMHDDEIADPRWRDASLREVLL